MTLDAEMLQDFLGSLRTDPGRRLPCRHCFGSARQSPFL